MAALVAALPPAPAGVVAADAKPFDFKNPPAIYEVLCEGSKEGDFSLTARRDYTRKHSEAERRYWSEQYDTLTAQFHALKKLPADKVAEQQALRQQSNAAWQAMRDAEKAGDKSAAQASDARYRSLRNQADAMDAQHAATVQTQTRDLDERRTSIDLEQQRVSIVIGMNLQRLPAPREGAAAGSHGVASPGKSAGLVVHNLAWSAVGSDGPLRQTLVAALAAANMQGLVGKPPPSEAASEAAATAARATPRLVPDFAPATVAAGSATGPAVSTPPGVPVAPGPGSATTAAAAPSPAPAPVPAPVSVPASASTSKPVSAAASAGTPATDAAKKAADAVNRLRSLFGR